MPDWDLQNRTAIMLSVVAAITLLVTGIQLRKQMIMPDGSGRYWSARALIAPGIRSPLPDCSANMLDVNVWYPASRQGGTYLIGTGLAILAGAGCMVALPQLRSRGELSLLLFFAISVAGMLCTWFVTYQEASKAAILSDCQPPPQT